MTLLFSGCYLGVRLFDRICSLGLWQLICRRFIWPSYNKHVWFLNQAKILIMDCSWISFCYLLICAEILDSGSLNLLPNYDKWDGKIIDCFYQKCDLKNFFSKETLVSFEVLPISSSSNGIYSSLHNRVEFKFTGSRLRRCMLTYQ